MTITVTGRIAGRSCTLAWDEGALTGDQEAKARAVALLDHRVNVHLPGLVSGQASLAKGEYGLAAATMAASFDSVTGLEGWTPEALPPRAIP